MLDEIRDLRDSLECYQGLEHSLVELAKATEFNHTQLSERVTELRAAIDALTGATKTTAARPPATPGRARGGIDRAPLSAGSAGPAGVESVAGSRPATMIAITLIVGALLTGWSIRVYLKTGNPYVAALGLVVVNLAGCAAILIRRRSVR